MRLASVCKKNIKSSTQFQNTIIMEHKARVNINIWDKYKCDGLGVRRGYKYIKFGTRGEYKYDGLGTHGEYKYDKHRTRGEYKLNCLDNTW